MRDRNAEGVRATTSATVTVVMFTMLDASGLRTGCRAEALRTGALRTAELRLAFAGRAFLTERLFMEQL